MKAIFWRVRTLEPLVVDFWTKLNESNTLHTKVSSLKEPDIKLKITEITGLAKFMLVKRDKKK